MAYASASDVSSLTPHLLSGSTASSFTAATSPTLTEVNGWLSSGCGIIELRIAAKGFGSIPTTSIAYEYAKQANALFAAYMAERSRLSARVSKDENTRGDVFKADFEDMLKQLEKIDLSRVGVSRSRGEGKPYAGGISESDKQSYENDSDRIRPRFGRGQFRNKETIGPDVSNADEQTRDN